MPDGTPQGPEGDRIEATVRAVLTTMAGDLTSKESALLAELEGLGRTIARAKAEIAALKVEDIRDAHIPSATDELDAIVDHTAHATNEILDCCETLEQMQSELSGEAADKLQGAVTRIYEACSSICLTANSSIVINHLLSVFPCLPCEPPLSHPQIVFVW